ncbi:MAG: hypothetical protein ACKORL_11670, partial [Phycisphaerales bacterium]
VPALALAAAIVGRASLDRFLETSGRGTVGSCATAAAAGSLCGMVAVGHLVLAAVGQGTGAASHVARVAERAMLAGWTFAAAVPATVFALSLVAAWNGPVLGPLVYDTPAIMALCHVGRFGVVGAWLGRMPALREPVERRDLRAVDGVGMAGVVAALAPEARGAWFAAAACGTARAAGEVIASARLEPPGWAWSASTLLNAIHYQQPSTVLGGLLAVLVVSGAAGASVAWLAARRSSCWRRFRCSSEAAARRRRRPGRWRSRPRAGSAPPAAGAASSNTRARSRSTRATAACW